MTHADILHALTLALAEGPGAENSARLRGDEVLVLVSGGDSCGGHRPPGVGGSRGRGGTRDLLACLQHRPLGASGPYEGPDGEEWYWIGEVR